MENNTNGHNKTHRRGKITLALILIAAGFILLGINTGWIPQEYRRVFISWQMLLIVIGITNFVKGHYWGGSILLIIGGFFLMPVINKIGPNLFAFIPANFVDLYWPVLLILFGSLLILRWLFPNSACLGHHNRTHRPKWWNTNEKTENGFIESNNVFGSGEHIVLDTEFKGGEINSVFGGTKLDLRRTSLAEGTTTLEVNLVFSGIEIELPPNWNVVVKVDTILGGFEDKRYTGGGQVDTSRTLLIKGSCIFGAGTLKN